MTRITNATRQSAEELVARTFNVAESDARIEAARRNVDMTEVALEQWYVWFSAGKYSQARQWWFENIESN